MDAPQIRVQLATLFAGLLPGRLGRTIRRQGTVTHEATLRWPLAELVKSGCSASFLTKR